MLNWKHLSKPAKYRFIIWLMLTSVLVFVFTRLIFTGFPVNTNVLDLLPGGIQNPITAQASQKFSNTLGNKVVFLIGNESKAKAILSADLFYKNLSQRASPAAHQKLFLKINYKMDASSQQAWGKFYFPYRLNLLTAEQQHTLLKNKASTIEQAAIMNLYSPMGMTNSELMKKDPFFLFQKYLMSMPKPARHIELSQNRLMVKSGDRQTPRWYVMITTELKGDSFSIAT